jgi:adenine-specific DNA-methyltransferase
MTIWKYTEVGHSQDATKELKEVFDGKAVFSYPKSVRLIERIIGLYAGKNDLFLDSFAGSGTTAQAVLNLNKRDGGNRKFILVEMEDYAENITAERVRRVINGYGVGKNAVEGTGGDFSYYELGEPLMIDGYLNERQPLQKIRNYIWYTETHTPLTDAGNSSCYLGRYHNADYYFYYNKEAVTTLSYDTLDIIAERAEQYIVYADQCLIDKDDLMAKNIIFKKIPRDIRKF